MKRNQAPAHQSEGQAKGRNQKARPANRGKSSPKSAVGANVEIPKDPNTQGSPKEIKSEKGGSPQSGSRQGNENHSKSDQKNLSLLTDRQAHRKQSAATEVEEEQRSRPRLNRADGNDLADELSRLRNRPPVVSVEIGGAAFGDYDYPTVLIYVCEVMHAHRALIRSRIVTRGFLRQHRERETMELEFHEALAIAERVCELSRDPCSCQGGLSRANFATDEPHLRTPLPERFSVDLPGLGGSEARDAETWLSYVCHPWYLAAERVSTVLLGGLGKSIKTTTKTRIKNQREIKKQKKITVEEVAVADSLAIAEAALDRLGIATELDELPEYSAKRTVLQKQALRCRVKYLAGRC